MKTVIADNSLCANAIFDNARSEDIYNYIEMLAAAGVKYVELDFRTVMKLRELPKGVGYIFRLVDPMFMRLTEVFDFDYLLITFPDLKKKISTKIPLMLELPVMDSLPGRAVRFAQAQVDGEIQLVRLCGSYNMFTPAEASAYVMRVKNDVTVPVDFCPMNAKKTAVDCAVRFAFASADSLTLSMGSNGRFASFEDFVFTLMSVYDTIPSELNAGAMCRASIYNKYIFKNSRRDSVLQLMEILDNDIRMLTNGDTGERVKTRVRLKDAQFMRQSYVSAVEKMMKNEDLPADIFDELLRAVKSTGAGVFDDDILAVKHKGLLN